MSESLNDTGHSQTSEVTESGGTQLLSVDGDEDTPSSQQQLLSVDLNGNSESFTSTVSGAVSPGSKPRGGHNVAPLPSGGRALASPATLGLSPRQAGLGLSPRQVGLGERLSTPASNRPATGKTSRIKKLKKPNEDDDGLAPPGGGRSFSRANELFFESVETTFRQFDADGTGSIDKDELGECLAAMGYDLGPEQLDGLLQQVDVDGGGTLDMEEFTTLIKLWMEAAQFKVIGGDSGNSTATQHMAQSVSMRVPTWLPDAPWRWLWDVMYLMVQTYFWMSVAASWAFNDGPARALLKTALIAPDIIATIFLFADMGTRCNLATMSPTGVLITERKSIIKYYLATWFFLDLVAAIPFRLFLETGATNNDSQNSTNIASLVLQHLRLLLVFRLPTLFMRSGMMTIDSRYIKFHYQYLPYVYMICGFIALVFTGGAIEHQLRVEDIHKGRMAEEDHRFAASFYWVLYCLTSVGYGDRGAQYTLHMWYASFLFTTSILLNGLFIGKMVELMQEADVVEMRKNKLATTQAVLNFFEVPEGLGYEVMQFQNHVLQHDVASAFSDVVECLPEEMKFNIVMQSRVPLLAGVHVFNTTHISTLIQMAGEMYSVFFMPSEPVLSPGQYNDTLFIVSYGFLDVVRPTKGTLEKTITRGGYFGEAGMLQGENRSYYNYKTLTYCELWAITHETLEMIGMRIPKFGKEMKAMAFLVKESIPVDPDVAKEFFDGQDAKDEKNGVVPVSKQPGLSRVGTMAGMLGASMLGGSIRMASASPAPGRVAATNVHAMAPPLSRNTSNTSDLDLFDFGSMETENAPPPTGGPAQMTKLNLMSPEMFTRERRKSAEGRELAILTPPKGAGPGHGEEDLRTKQIEDHLFELIEDESAEVGRLTAVMANLQARAAQATPETSLRSNEHSQIEHGQGDRQSLSGGDTTGPLGTASPDNGVVSQGDGQHAQLELSHNSSTSHERRRMEEQVEVLDAEVEAEMRRLFKQDPVLASLTV